MNRRLVTGINGCRDNLQILLGRSCQGLNTKELKDVDNK